jgi:3',5'-cyclic AMP phosphodiesterase CpdA
MQYKEAEEFISQLADSFVGGDRQRVVVIPGNHDVSLWHTVQSFRPLPINPASLFAKIPGWADTEDCNLLIQ